MYTYFVKTIICHNIIINIKKFNIFTYSNDYNDWFDTKYDTLMNMGGSHIPTHTNLHHTISVPRYRFVQEFGTVWHKWILG